MTLRILWKSAMLFFFLSCNQLKGDRESTSTIGDSISIPVDDTISMKKDTTKLAVNKLVVNTGNVDPKELLGFAQTLIGTPYKYGSTDPNAGFDCSGFITYVFNHFNIKVPRSSVDFTEVGKTIYIDSAKPGDLILFTGTDSTEKHVGHMGIVTSNSNKPLEFIHSTSGKAQGVTITPLNKYYTGRFVRIARIFPQNER